MGKEIDLKDYKFIGMIMPGGIPANNSRELIVSICFNINTYSEVFHDLNDDKNQARRYNEFREKLLQFYSNLGKLNLSVTKDGNEVKILKTETAKLPFQFLFKNEISKAPNAQDYEECKKTLWKEIFSLEVDQESGLLKNGKEVDPKSKVKIYHQPDPEPFVSKKDTDQFIGILNSLISDNSKNEDNEEVSNGEFGIYKTLQKINEFGKNRIKDAKFEFLEFQKRVKSNSQVVEHLNTLNAKEVPSLSAHFDPIQNILDLYSEHSNSIDIDEIVNSFGRIADDPILSRLMGFTVDFKVVFEQDFEDNTDLIFQIPKPSESIDNHLYDDLLFLDSPIRCIKKNDKCAYLIHNEKDKSKYFEMTLLKGENMSIETTDQVQQMLKVNDYLKRKNQGQKIEQTDLVDGLTRGLMFTHNELDKLIKPVDIAGRDSDNNPVTKINIDGLSKINEEYFIRGYRVALVSGKGLNKFHSLTSRSVKIKEKLVGKEIYYKGQNESCIHFDSAMNYLDDGEQRSKTSNVLFEYSGELLKLKSAFAKSYNPKKIDHSAEKTENFDDDGLKKVENRWSKVIEFKFFPDLKSRNNSPAKYSVINDIPAQYRKGEAPQLRFGREYSSIVSYEYLNGWGMPLENTGENSKQLSIKEIIQVENDRSKFMPNAVTFAPAENKRPPILIPTKKVKSELGESFLEKPSLEHMVVLSNSAQSPAVRKYKCHLIPPKIDMETGFFHNLISPPKMSLAESYNLKNRTNCPYPNEDSRKKDRINKRCIECGKLSYCGGVELKEFYTSSFSPPFLTDPTIKGLEFDFYWKWHGNNDSDNIECVELKKTAIEYKGEKGSKIKSYLMGVNDGQTESQINHVKRKSFIEFDLKKGIQLEVALTNTLTEEGVRYLNDGAWLRPLLTEKQLNNETLHFKRNHPKIIKLTHAVREPLVCPEILKISSIPDDRRRVEHLHDWLRKEEYRDYRLGENVIAKRINTGPTDIAKDSTKIRMELTSHFERLDAFRKIQFIKDRLPTGGLELWVRKEEFIDDPNYHVGNSDTSINHLPSNPVVDFRNMNNVFSLEHKIEFTNEVLIQMKTLKNVEDIESVSDVFRSLITKLCIEYDIKSSRFEEREYFLKGISKFKGFFTDEKLDNHEDEKVINKLEQFALPKMSDVMKDLKDDSILRFKVMVLNNSQPPKPDIAFAITTIQEQRSFPKGGDRTISVQKGNIVTIYLKRGRLKSGKDERVGIIVESDSPYNHVYKERDMLSKAGKDILSDRFGNRSQFLQYGDILIPNSNEFKVEYIDDMGLYSYSPIFDKEKGLWKIELMLNIRTKDGRDLHNPFVNFSIVHFQPFSINYNDKSSESNIEDLKKDCRLSDVEHSTWCYLLPERKLSVYFDKPNFWNDYGQVDLTVSFDHESLHHFNEKQNEWKIRSNFIVSVQGSLTGDAWDWHDIGSWINEGQPSKDTDQNIDEERNMKYHHGLLSTKILERKENLVNLRLNFKKWADPNDIQNSVDFKYFRIRFVEVEWFTNESLESAMRRHERDFKDDILNNEEMRVRYVELIY